MLRQTLILTGLGLAMWAVSLLFFLLFGDWLLVSTEDAGFGASLFLLEALTVLVLIGISLVVRLRLFRQPGSATRLGYLSTAIGLLLNTFVLWNRDSVFSKFDAGQHQAFSVWMTLAYAFFLIVPAITDRLIRSKPEPAVSAEAALEGYDEAAEPAE
ncbi:hypothetical protein [Cohnella fermenti]|uniref:Uncharacterized protein n=1 Tax=Cohnella fermenti TaxID=2565925 RepID=A0A4S4BFD6_9BACL|nr:hypothetical protein [Cohnella fermenti]THF73041.1 hypothetical protein E6C55_30845 [Cohnella fermenti]